MAVYFSTWREISKISDTKVEGIFVGPQIKEIRRDGTFDETKWSWKRRLESI
jgi:hypothetical protein